MRFKSIACVSLVFVLLLGSSCKTQEEITQQQNQQNKTTQEIVIKQELEREQRTMSVVGVGKVYADPDVATINVSVVNQAETVEETQQQSALLMEQVLLAIREQGIADSNIRVQEVTAPVHDNSKNPSEVTGYSITNNITIKLSNVKKTGDLVTSMILTGAEILQIEYHLLDETVHYQQALALAVEDAQDKAQIMAASAGVDLQGPVAMQEDIEVMQAITKVIAYESPTVSVQATEDGLSPTSQIQPSQITVAAEVSIDYMVKWPGSPIPAA
ncbi:SIMPL domain-containing protein [Eubacteriales bacterium OttesenSCG-928-K08]|nr:SIMPL domain-containing protein [Eubacteriales bacterium OttesenSCG-928-K08]